jgi:hypothetical protein
MFSLTRLLSFGISKGLAALLVLALSIVGGVRFGFERLSNQLEEQRPALVLTSVNQAGETSAPQHLAVQNQRQFSGHQHISVCLLTPRMVAVVRVPTPRCGSAGGARAPNLG